MNDPGLSVAYSHFSAGRWAQARAALVRIVQRSPRHPVACAMMAVAFAHEGQRAQAVHYAAIAAASDDPMALHAVGKMYTLLGMAPEAVRTLRRALALAPGAVDTMNALGTALLTARLPAEAARLLGPAAARGGPSPHPLTLSILGVALHQCGRIEEGLGLIRRAAEMEPANLETASVLASTLAYAPGVGPEEQRDAFVRHGRLLAGAAPSLPPIPARRPGEKIRVGFLSPDFRNHATAFFAEPILEHLDRGRFFVAVYMTHAEDVVSTRLRTKSDLWRSAAGMSPADLARGIRADAIDVLVDLAGPTLGGSLPALALRPARVQATMIGFPATTGVPGVGLRIVDSLSDPPGTESHNTERLVRIDPCFLCYRPPEHAPEVTARRAGAAMTFVSFSNLAKLNDGLLTLWADVLRAVPGSRLRLRHQGLAEEEVREDVRRRFASRGVEPDRISPETPTPTARELLPEYADADIMLDTFPYNGTTTICESLLMGVPVVTLSGDTSPSRVGRSLLTAAGLPELCAGTREEYVRLAADLACDAGRLAELRASLRTRFVGSAVCDAPAYARRLGEALAAAVEEG